jgi:hypothetical protein
VLIEAVTAAVDEVAQIIRTIEHALRRRIGGEFELMVDDPRRAPTAP